MKEVITTSASGGQKGTKAECYDLIPTAPLHYMKNLINQVPASAFRLTPQETYARVTYLAELFWDDADTIEYQEALTNLTIIGVILAEHYANPHETNNAEGKVESLIHIDNTYAGNETLPKESIEALSRHYGVGAKKYAAHNWRKGYEISKNYAAFHRHLASWNNGENIDEETGSPHIISSLWHVFTMIHFLFEINKGRLPKEYDDRPRIKKGAE